ncbi:MarR family transcriptional regulator [Actinoplanes sp. NPDC023936]|uniref:MarR family winged helix-turn-helix transcriptional regulator n=1 Tax=Actinoplanes sp. NPDC023936 TaxID=3154910 RepID=UPI0033D59DC7
MHEQGVTAMPSMLYLVKQLELAVRARLDEVVRSSGITALQYTALTVLERHDGLSAAQLARDSFVTAQSMADMVRALESRGLIRRERNTGNRRELLIRLTPEGRALLAAVSDPVAELENRMTSKMSPAQTADFRQSLITGWQSLT